MCGIGGVWQRDEREASFAQLTRMMSAMAHRGPEGAAFARLDRGQLLLGFLSLAFTEQPVAGMQPLFNEDYSIALVYNGEIYDHMSLRDDLIERGHRFRNRSDSEVIIHLYEEYGEQMFEHLNGEFAFVLWDARSGQLLCVRDRIGIKPLFYAEHNGAFVFASEIKGLLSLDGFHAEIDPLYFTGPGAGVADCAATAFSGVRAVRPGHVLRVSADGLEQRPYWLPDFTKAAERTFEMALEQLDYELTQAVVRRVGGDVPVALSLSSGVDSATIAALSLRAGRSLPCFGIAYPGALYDESAAAQRTARHLGLTFEPVVCTPTSLADGYLRSIRSTEVAQTSLSSISRMALMSAIRGAGYKAVCNGEGSDELFGGYPYFRQEALWREIIAGGARAERARLDLKAFRQLEARSKGIFWPDVDGWKEPSDLFGYPSAYHVQTRGRAAVIRRVMSRRALKAMAGATTTDAMMRELEPYELHRMDPFDATRVVSRSLFSSIIVPLLGDRVEMSASLEGRSPFTDYNVIKLAYSLPQEHCLEPGSLVQKRIVRSLAAPLLPADFSPPTKHNRLSPTFRAFSKTSVGGDLIDDLLSGRAVRDAGLLSGTAVAALRTAWRLAPGGGLGFARLDSALGYMLGVQALHHVFVASPPDVELIELSVDKTPI
jgi:asparagine synthase (glutamine-hydrolysing)